MGDPGDDKSTIGDCRGGVVQIPKAAADTVRQNDQRELIAAQRTILGSNDGYSGDLDAAGRLRTRVPDRACERRTVGIGRHLDEPETGSLRKRRYETEGDYDDEPGSMHRVGLLAMPLATRSR